MLVYIGAICAILVRRRMAEVNANPDLFFRWTVDSKLHEAHAAVCEYLHLPPKNLVFVENATTGMHLFS